MAEPPDYEEKPIVDTEMSQIPTRRLTIERPRAKAASVARPHPYKIHDKPLTHRPTKPQCSTCEKSFLFWQELVDHEDEYSGRPHIFCKPCDMVVKQMDYNAHRLSKYHMRFTQDDKADVAKMDPHVFFAMKLQNPLTKYAYNPTIVYRTAEREEVTAADEIKVKVSKHHSELKSWEKAAGALNAEDILLGIEPCEKKKAPSRRLFYDESDEAPFGPLHRFPCPVRECGAGFLVNPLLTRHMFQHHLGLDPFWCQLCPASYWDLDPFLSHMENNHGVAKPEDNPEGYSCSECGRHFDTTRPYYCHRMRWEGKPHFFCCGLEMQAGDFEKHQSIDHSQKKQEPCKDCGKEFVFWRDLHQHVEFFGGKPHRYCEPCNATIREEGWEGHQKKREHRVNTLSATEEDPLLCKVCGMSFSTAMRFVDHCDAYKEGPHFRCEPCNEMVAETREEHQKSRRHRINTSREKHPTNRWKCPVAQCGVSFRYEYLMNEHMSKHPGEKPFACSQCSKTFPYSTSLKTHVKCHS